MLFDSFKIFCLRLWPRPEIGRSGTPNSSETMTTRKCDEGLPREFSRSEPKNSFKRPSPVASVRYLRETGASLGSTTSQPYTCSKRSPTSHTDALVSQSRRFNGTPNALERDVPRFNVDPTLDVYWPSLTYTIGAGPIGILETSGLKPVAQQRRLDDL